jgi:hypothetical protein
VPVPEPSLMSHHCWLPALQQVNQGGEAVQADMPAPLPRVMAPMQSYASMYLAGDGCGVYAAAVQSGAHWSISKMRPVACCELCGGALLCMQVVCLCETPAASGSCCSAVFAGAWLNVCGCCCCGARSSMARCARQLLTAAAVACGRYAAVCMCVCMWSPPSLRPTTIPGPCMPCGCPLYTCWRGFVPGACGALRAPAGCCHYTRWLGAVIAARPHSGQGPVSCLQRLMLGL